MENRRKRYRFVERNEILIRTSLNRYQGTGVGGYTYDLSTGGARIVSKKGYPVGTLLRIRMDLAKTNRTVIVDGEVRWLKFKEGEAVFEMGIDFRNLTSRTVLTLIKHLYGDMAGANTPTA